MCGYALYTLAEWSSGKPTTDLTAGEAPEPLLFLPAAGCRYYYNGAVDYPGTDGLYWSSTVTNFGSHYLNLGSEGVYASSNGSRALGFSVRCVAE
jgi:hypothetical protein